MTGLEPDAMRVAADVVEALRDSGLDVCLAGVESVGGSPREYELFLDAEAPADGRRGEPGWPMYEPSVESEHGRASVSVVGDLGYSAGGRSGATLLLEVSGAIAVDPGDRGRAGAAGD